MAPTPAFVSKTVAQLLLRRCGGFSLTVKWAPQPPEPSSTFSTSAAAISFPSEEERRGLGWSRFLLFVPGAITFGLGTWQILRREDKDKYYNMNEIQSMFWDMVQS